MRLARLHGTVRRQRHDSEGPSLFRKIRKWVNVTMRALGVPHKNTPRRAVDHGAESDLRTASSMPDDSRARSLHIPEAARRDGSLGPVGPLPITRPSASTHPIGHAAGIDEVPSSFHLLASARHNRLSSGNQERACHRPTHRPIREENTCVLRCKYETIYGERSVATLSTV